MLIFVLYFCLNLLIHQNHNNNKIRILSDLDRKFEKFRIDFNKSYQSEQEYYERKEIFRENLETIRVHNSNTDALFKLSINQFSDMTFSELYDFNLVNDELESKVDDSKLIQPNIQYLYDEDLNIDDKDVPDSFDWRDVGIISRVKDQGIHCGSCYVHAALEEIESQFLIIKNKSYEFSRQEIVDCAKAGHGILGCSGGILYGVHSYIRSLGGISKAKNYPYIASESECRTNVTRIQFILSGIINTFESEDEKILKKALFKLGPIVALIDNLHDSFFRYSSGIYYEPECNESDKLSHAVVLVGYGRGNDGIDYWTIKNSYSEKWGEEGYMRIARNKDNHCGIASFNMITKL